MERYAFFGLWNGWSQVHINSGIPNFAFYLVADGLDGYVWEKPGKIWYGALTDRRLKYNASFKQFAVITVDVALKLYDQAVSDVVKNAWIKVGVLEADSEWEF